MGTTRRATLKRLAAASLAVAHGLPRAQADRTPVTLLVGAASSMDVVGRLLAEQLGREFARPHVLVSKLGAGGRLALGELRHAAPDGRTLMFSTSSPFALYPNIYTKLDYDPVTDFTPIAGVSWFDVAIAVSNESGIKSLPELVAWLKAHPSQAVYGAAPSNGSLSHFTGIATSLAIKLPLQQIPYKDSGVGITDMVSNRLPVLITGTGALVEMHRAGRLRIVAVSGTQRCPLLPDVPTMREAGIAFDAVNSTGLFGPARLPAELVARLHAATRQILQRPAVLERLASQAMAPLPLDPGQLAAALADDRKRFAALVKASGFVPEPA